MIHGNASDAYPLAGAVRDPRARYALALGDDALILAQRCAQWVTRAPQLEEDVALANLGLDLLGQARMLLARAGGSDPGGPGEDAQAAEDAQDALAYLRDAHEFCNVRLVELPNGDFAFSMARLLAFSTYQLGLYQRLVSSADDGLAAIAAKAVKEVSYHVDHATMWVLRLGDGTELSRRRMQAGLDAVWPYVDELFDGSFVPPALLADGVAVDPAGLRGPWRSQVADVLDRATLAWPRGPGSINGDTDGSIDRDVGGGRGGRHTPALTELLAELQSLHRAHPGASW
jgi:ring-1,2-phenylacetyl-CoA epoxidase subunit PaaC